MLAEIRSYEFEKMTWFVPVVDGIVGRAAGTFAQALGIARAIYDALEVRRAIEAEWLAERLDIEDRNLWEADEELIVELDGDGRLVQEAWSNASEAIRVLSGSTSPGP